MVKCVESRESSQYVLADVVNDQGEVQEEILSASFTVNDKGIADTHSILASTDQQMARKTIAADQLFPTNSPTLYTVNGLAIASPAYDPLKAHSLMIGNPWNYACITAKARAATKLGFGFRLADKVVSETGKLEVLDKTLPLYYRQRIHQEIGILKEFFYNILQYTGQSFSDVLYSMSIDYFSTGNAYLEIVRSLFGKLLGVMVVPSISVYRHKYAPLYIQLPGFYSGASYHETMRALLEEDNKENLYDYTIFPRVFSNIKRATYFSYLSDKQKKRSYDNYIMPLHNIIPSTDMLYGVSDGLSAVASILGDNAASDYNLQFFTNSAVPRYAITLEGAPKLMEDTRDKILKFFRDEVKGQAHRTIVIPVPRNSQATFHPLETQQNDGSFLNYKMINREEIATIHGVPPSEIGLWESANKANALQQSKNFFLKTISPYQRTLEKYLNMLFKHTLGIQLLEFKFKNVEYTDDTEKAELDKTIVDIKNSQLNALVGAINALKGTTFNSETPVDAIVSFTSAKNYIEAQQVMMTFIKDNYRANKPIENRPILEIDSSY